MGNRSIGWGGTDAEPDAAPPPDAPSPPGYHPTATTTPTPASALPPHHDAGASPREPASTHARSSTKTNQRCTPSPKQPRRYRAAPHRRPPESAPAAAHAPARTAPPRPHRIRARGHADRPAPATPHAEPTPSSRCGDSAHTARRSRYTSMP